MDIKAIETEYNGYRFRSRAEARWAVFFDACGIKYQYEPEGYKLSDGTFYLPDFYLPDSKTFFEVKGVMSDKDMHKIKLLQEDLHCSVAIGYADMTFQASDRWEEDVFSISNKADSYFVKCNNCDKYYFIGGAGAYTCTCCNYYDGDATFDLILFGDLDRYKVGQFMPLDKARQARFEHGETPKTPKKINWDFDFYKELENL